jgi:hypothetical protein
MEGFPRGDLFNLRAQSLPEAYGIIGDLCFVGVLAPHGRLLDPMKRFLRGAGSSIYVTEYEPRRKNT